MFSNSPDGCRCVRPPISSSNSIAVPDVKFRYPCDGVGPVAVRRSCGVDAVGSAGGVGEGAVLAGGVVTDGVGADHGAFEGDLDVVVDDGDLDLLASVCAADAVAGGGEADRAGGVDLAGDRVARWARRDGQDGSLRVCGVCGLRSVG